MSALHLPMRGVRLLVVSLVTVALTLLGLTVTATPATAADVVAVPDANFKAALNTAIAATDGTTRTPDQDITPAEAQSVTTIDTGIVEGAPIASLTGLEAFTNVTTLTLIHFGSTVTDLRPIGSLNKLTSLTAWFMPFSSLDGLESVATLNYLDVQGNDQLADVSALSQLTQLTSVVVRESPPLKDISALAASKATLETVIVEGGAVEDIDFLEGFKNVTNIGLAGNRIEDVSVFSTFDDSYALNDSLNNSLSLNQNRIRDFSPVVAFYAIRGLSGGPRVSVSGQSIYVGPYDAANGVTVPLKSGPNQSDSNPPATPSVEPGVGTYDAETGLLTSADPAAPFVRVDPNWTIHFSEAPDKVVSVPDANFKAVLNNAIAATDGTTRTPDQDITPAEAQAVTTIDTGINVAGAPIATLTGLEAFTNITSLTIRHTGSTVTDLRPIGALHQLTYLVLGRMQITNLQGLETLTSLQTLGLYTQDLLADVSALSSLSQLTHVTINLSPRLKDVSALAASKGAMEILILTNSGINDISFLTGFKNASNMNLSNNRVEDVSVFSTFDDSYALNDTTNNVLSLTGNRIRDFSPVVAFHAISGLGFGPRASAFGQSIYVGPYDAANGVTVPLKSGPNYDDSAPPATPTVEPGVGTYDAETGLLTSADPAAPFVKVDPNWTVYFSEAPDKVAALRVNEVESDGDTVNGDWVELYNPGSTVVDLSGLVVADNDNTHTMVVPAGTKIPAQGYQTVVTENGASTGAFGLDSADSVRVFAPGTTDLASAPIDSYSWTEHASTTYGRTVPGAGRWTTTSGGTFGAVNAFASAGTVTVSGEATSTTGSASLTATVAKPGSTDVATDATGTVVFAVDGTDASGPVAVTDGTATWTATGLTGSPAGIAHQVTARYVAAGESDPYESSVPSAEFTVTVTIGEFAGNVTLSTSAPQVCGTITADLSGITPAPDSVTYQWQSKTDSSPFYSWVNLAAASGASHALAFTVVDGQLVAPNKEGLRRLVVTVSRVGYATKTLTSAETASIAAAPFLTKPAATLSTSTPKVGETITATHPKWTSCIPAELNFEPGYDYQWLRDGQPIAGATDTSVNGIGGAGPKQVSYTPTPADAGHKISLQVHGNAPGLSYDRAVSPETSAVTAGAFTTAPAPVIDKMSPKLGDMLTATTAAWSPVAAFARQWLRDGQPISGATAATYTTTVADVGHAISVRVTGTAEGYAATDKTSTPTAQVAARTFTTAPAPVIDDTTPTEGDTLTATVAAWSPTATQAWQWLRDGQPISGATQATYPVVAGDVGHVLSARVTGTATGYQARSETSQPTAVVAAKAVPAPVNVITSVTSNYKVKFKTLKGKKLQVTVSAKGVPAAELDTKATLKVAGLKGAYKVTIKNGKATVVLGAKAKDLAKGTKVEVTLVLPELVFTTTTGTTTTSYTITKATDKVTVKLK